MEMTETTTKSANSRRQHAVNVRFTRATSSSSSCEEISIERANA